jgi:hypothetical protein
VRTVCGWGRWAQRRLGRRDRSAAAGVARVRPLAGGRRPLVTDALGEQRRGGARLDQVDGTTCGSAVLVAMAAWADPAELDRYERVPVGAPAGAAGGFGARYDARQKQVHRESTRLWPRMLGTSPWGMVSWLRRHAPGAGPYRVRLVDDTSAADVADVLREAGAALAAGRPVPLLVGPLLPRHYCMALSAQGAAWRVYEPTAGRVHELDPELVHRRALAPVLGFDRLHAVLLPA